MADILHLSGTVDVQPASGFPSGDPSTDIPLDETVTLKRQMQSGRVDLDTDATKVVNFGDLAGANVVILRANFGKVKARFTSADGAVQSIPVDPLLTVISLSVPFTALDLTRVAGQGNTVQVNYSLGEKA